jgi:hypothetical protein
LNQQCFPPLRLQASHCSAFRIMCDVPSIAVIIIIIRNVILPRHLYVALASSLVRCTVFSHIVLSTEDTKCLPSYMAGGCCFLSEPHGQLSAGSLSSLTQAGTML